jgi:uncharacterized protein with HEPN domain
VSRTDDQRVLDILDAADQIAGVVKDGRKAWDQDRLRQLAVERLLEIIGESANTLSDEFRAACPEVRSMDTGLADSLWRTERRIAGQEQ